MDISTIINEGVNIFEIVVQGITKLIPIVKAYPEASLVVFALAYLNRKKIKRIFRRAVIGF